jgi:myosin-crossreactive antigen
MIPDRRSEEGAQMTPDPLTPRPLPAMHYLVGGGIASLAAAVLLIRDAGVPGRCIQVFEQSDTLGGSLDGSGTPNTGYLMRGGRMFDENFACTFDLLASIPSIVTVHSRPSTGAFLGRLP